jgi:glycerophosphoryl diester phosphodiesterase
MRNRPLVEAHRGDSLNAPENTLAAFACAIRLSVDSIELDVHLSKDGTLMVLHDDTIDRTTGGRGSVTSLTAAELARLDAGAKFSPSFAGERIPRLVDVLEMVADGEILLNVEIKATPPGIDVPRKVAALLRQFGGGRGHVVSSFDLQALLDVRAIDPDIPLALIGRGPAILRLAVQHRLPWIHARHTTVTSALVAQAHAEGIRVNAWTVDDPGTLDYWTTIGLDKVCTNRPGLMLERLSQG